MFLIRFAVVLVGLIMLLPTGPSDNSNSPTAMNGRNDRFCDRYPKVCDASGEVYAAFRKKLAYGITLARQSLNSQPGGSHTGAGPYGGPNAGDQYGQRWGKGSNHGGGDPRLANRYEARPAPRWDGTRRRDCGPITRDAHRRPARHGC
jgi:hypothetical protein